MTTILKIDGALGAQFKADAEAAANRAELAASEAEAASLATDILPGGPCAAVATTNVTLSGVQNIDSVTGAVDQRVLLTAQSTASQNGVWLQKAGAWARPSDFNSAGEAFQGVSVFVTGGGNGGLYVLTTSGTITIDTTAQNWAQASGALKSQGIEVQMPALSGGGNSGKTALSFLPPSGMISTNGTDNAVAAGVFNTVTKFTNGPVGNEQYYDTVIGFGTNSGPNALPVENFTGSASFRVESYYYQNDNFCTETIIGHFDTAGNEQRVFQAVIPINAADRVEDGYVRMTTPVFQIDNYEGNTGVQFNLSAANRNIAFGVGGYGAHPILRFLTNDRFVAQQINAAGSTFLALPYINASNNLQISQSIHATGAPANTPLGTVAFATFFATSGAASQVNMLLQCPSITGNFFPLIARGSATGRFNAQIYNTGSGQTVLELQTLAGASNDAILAFSNVGGGQSWTIASDNSDGDKLKIESSYLTTGTAAALFVEFDATAGISRFAKPLRLPSYTVAGLLAAATAGAGARAFVTDANATTFASIVAGGGANGVPVYSDGTNWRIG